ncbi:PEP/pyruvate-binding domain-containing protein [Bacteriovorax sp. DB6_IX]|uniref:PEP/pyruvate-binding domain-containing protein n=1 Tax=Bacteriovorax sp. DB6_IX TaxID=1353530 RepID=UPI00038A55DB|nr:PEP/pyruvate-binding domain-containing protein [Bacteriovorax sp. DB6_IX]EQC52067.1 pyruvate phosphate dikinase, PEP/pyruvate-binding domain protein [Bacteriovorax sp. DB6_IX]
MLYSFKDLPEDKTSVGGKAYMLAMMTQMGIEVPDGMILDAPPSTEEFEEIIRFANDGEYSLAIRSSATGEDSKENSFAGQNSTFLYVDNDQDLKYAIENCFDSIHKESSKAYRKHFLGSSEVIPMNVVIQRMIDPSYAGVYFTKDPRGKFSTWMIEYIDGVGEDLVSGKRTPTILSESQKKSEHLSESQIDQIIAFANEVEKKYQDEFDIEWAIDKAGKVYLLQARPITAKSSLSNLKQVADKEISRLEKEHTEETVWDGQTFAEWTVAPTVLTTELWANSFKADQAFDKALKTLGYLGFEKGRRDSLLDTVFGKSYINLNKLGELYFGPIPYSIEPIPRPHLKFHFSKVSARVIFNTPKTLFRMLKVGLSINTQRKTMIEEATKELVAMSTKLKRPNDPTLYQDWSDKKLDKRIAKECYLFHERTLVWPYVLISLTETTIQTMISLLKSIYPEEQANDMIKRWSGSGINSETYEMGHYFKKACAKPEMRPLFLERYGHRGPGELDLSAMRWAEIGEDSFYDMSLEDYEKSKKNHSFIDVEKEIDEMKTFKKSIVLEEWQILKGLLELREKWKMALLKPYSHIRYLLLEKSSRLGLEDKNDIFWLKLEEIEHFEDSMLKLIQERKEEAQLFKSFNFSTVTSLKEIKDVISGDNEVSSDSFSGEGISSGIVKGEIVVINNPSEWKNIKWPQNPIVVAQSTDPGWTPVFTKASGIIVERGGVLSHCAIVAREMGIPAVSGINQCHLRFKGGENVWIDGNSGTVKFVQ